MPTKIIPLHDNINALFGKEISPEFNEPFYARESPYEVLRKIGERLRIHKYRDLEKDLRHCNMIRHKDNAGYFMYWGVSIEDFNQAGLEVNGTITDFDPRSLPEGSLEENAGGIYTFARKYFVDIDVLEEGITNYIDGIADRKTSRPQIQEGVSYLRFRDQNPEEDRELLLAQLLEFGKALKGEEFSMRDLEKIAKEAAKSIPREVQSRHKGTDLMRPPMPSMLSRFSF